MVGAIVVLLIVVALAASIVVAVVHKRKETARIAAMSPEERALHDAEQEHAKAVRLAESGAKAATKGYNKQVKVAEKGLKEAERFGRKQLGSYETVTVWEHEIKTDQGTFPINEEVVASVDTAGNLAVDRRATLTRMAAGTLVAGPFGLIAGGMLKKKADQDTRELYLMVEGESFATLVPCKPDDAVTVRQLATTINQAAKMAAANASQREIELAAARERVESAKANTHAVNEARRQLVYVQRDRAAIDRARADLNARASQALPSGEG